MSKNSARLLLSGASSIAIIAALTHTPAAAAQLFGPGAEPPIIISADTDFVGVSNATVAADGVGNAFVIQAGVTVAATVFSAVNFFDSTFQGSVVNNGSIIGDVGNAWNLNSNVIIGDLDNNGFIIGGSSLGGDGLQIFNTQITGSINNTETIAGGGGIEAIGLDLAGSTIGNDIVNSGQITGGSSSFGADGVRIVSSDVLGAIRNNDGGAMTGGASGGDAAGLNINSDSVVAEGIFNDGTIAGGTAGLNRAGIFVEDSDVGGGIHNNDGGTITGNFGISISEDSLLTGGIVNNATGSIIGRGNAGIAINGNTVFSGGISNHGWLTGGEGGVGIAVFESTFSGGIHNFAGGSIVGDGAPAIIIGSSTVYTGGLLNEGHIDAVDATAISIGAGNFSGTVNNAGLISSNATGIRVSGGLIGDGIFNSGTIQAVVAVDLLNTTPGQTVTQTDGEILGDIVFSSLGQSFFVGKGGYFQGDMIGSLASNDDVTVVSGTWSAEGTGFGLGDIFVTGGTGVFGGRFYGDLAGAGFDVTDSRNFGTTAGRAFIDDDSKMAFADDLSFGSEGILEFLLTSDEGRHGSVISTDYALLDGRIAGYFDWNSFSGLGNTQDFTYQNLIQTGDLVGTFDNEGDVDTNSVFFTAQAVHRDDQYVDINAHRIGFDEIVSNPTANQQAVGDSLEEIFADGGAPFLALEDPNGDGLENPQETSEGLYSALFQLATAGEVADAYGSLDGHNNAAIFQTTFTIASLLDRNIQSRLDDVRDGQGGTRSAGQPQRYAAAAIVAVDGASGAARASSGWSAWARAFGSWGNAEGDAFNEGFEQDSKGFGFGVDYATGRSLIGVAGQFASTDVEFDRPLWAPIGADANIDSWQVALYGYHNFGMLFIDGNASATFNDFATHRFDFWGQGISAAYDATVYSVYAELGADLNSGRFNFQPFAGIGFRHADFDNFVERCPLFCLAVAPEDAQSLYSSVGVRAAATYHWGRTPISPELRLAWQHEFSDDRGAFDAAFVGAPDSPFHVEGQKFAEDKFIVGAGVSVEVTRNFALFADYNGTFSSDFDAHSVAAGLRVTW